ncbi:MAG TPA: PQQ-binding-like beta-propeller repeat protein [bacterium]|nr:PQQ-binding-like beta-propeller repeat protein [bacterium]
MKFKRGYLFQVPSFAYNICQKDSLDKIWSKKINAYPENILSLNDQTLLIGDSRGGLMTLDLMEGEKIDRYWKDYIRPIRFYNIFDNVLYFTSINKNEIKAWDLKKARLKWKNKYDHDFTHLVHFNNKYFVKHDRGIARLDTSNGKITQELKLDARLAQDFIKTDQHMIVATENGRVLMINSKLKIVKRFDTEILIPRNLIYHENELLINNSSGKIRIIDINNFETVFVENYKKTIYATPLFINKKLIMGFADGEVIAINWKSGEVNWRFSRTNLLSLDMITCQDRVIVTYSPGEIYCLETTDGKQVWKYNAEKSINYVKLTHLGLLYSCRKKLNLIGINNEYTQN